MKKSSIAMLGAAVVLALASASSMAADAYAAYGTTGLRLGLDQGVGPFVSVRGEFNTMNYSSDFSTNSGNYTGTVKFDTAGLYADFHPFAGAFRLTAGALIGDHSITADGKASNNGTYTINGHSYSASGQSISATANYSSIEPYVGLGFSGVPLLGTRGLTFFADLGVVYAKPSLTMNVSSGLAAQAGQANISAEQQQLQTKADEYKYYPVISAGLGYAF